MNNLYRDILRNHCRPLEPIPTEQEPILPKLAGLRAVLFDLYGTLFISGSGEVGVTREAACGPALGEALAAVGIPILGPVAAEIASLFDTIEQFHAKARRSGIDYPEVDVLEVWRVLLADLAGRGLIDGQACRGIDLARLAVEYEARANPVWPMPGVEECLTGLRGKGIVLGVVSNAQFYTRELFGALMHREAEECGFEADLQFFSYQHGWGKPGLKLFQLAVEALGKRRIEPSEALYVGNDMLNDVFAAGKLGFRTALFAGDARSLRLREEEPRVTAVRPDLVLTALAQLDGCVSV